MRNMRRYAAVFLAFCTALTGITGCEKLVKSEVVTELPKTQAKQEANVGNAVGEAADTPLKEQLQAPERYTADFTTEEGIQITADAEMEIPEVDSILVKSIKPKELTREKVEEWLKIFCKGDLSGICEYEHTVKGQTSWMGTVTVDGIPYSYSFMPHGESKPGDPSQDMFTWRIDWQSWYRAEENTEEYRKLIELIGNEENGNWEQLQSDLETLLSDLGLNDIKVRKWGELNQPVIDRGKIGDNIFVYHGEKVVDNISINHASEDSLEWKDNVIVCGEEGLTAVYRYGILDSFMYMYPLETSSYSDEKQFLLPFEEIRQIFENSIGTKLIQMRSRQRSTEDSSDSIISDPENTASVSESTMGGVSTPSYYWWEFPYNDIENVKVNIYRVALGYMQLPESPDSPEKILIPVWDFYGTWDYTGYKNSNAISIVDEFFTLLTIDARDGTIITRKAY